jgi:hypothetical protein
MEGTNVAMTIFLLVQNISNTLINARNIIRMSESVPANYFAMNGRVIVQKNI